MWADRNFGVVGEHLPQSLKYTTETNAKLRILAVAGLVMASLTAPSQVSATPQPIAQKVTLSEARLATACVKSGQTKEDCICVTRTLRSKLPQYDYAPSLLLQTAHYSENGTSSARRALARQGVSAHEIKALDRQRRRVVMSANRADCGFEAEPTAS